MSKNVPSGPQPNEGGMSPHQRKMFSFFARVRRSQQEGIHDDVITKVGGALLNASKGGDASQVDAAVSEIETKLDKEDAAGKQ